MSEKKYYIGTAGWKYDDWIGSFYPKKESGGFDWLQFYSHYFNCIEVNSSYYVYLSDKVAGAWVRKTEGLEDFTFTLKLHQDFTHKRSYTKQNIDAVNYILRILDKAGRLGGLLVQFPQSFKFDQHSAEYISRLKEIFCAYDLFVEVRHGSFHTNESLDFFKASNINCITIDQPQIGNAIAFKPVITCDSLYIRLHGRNNTEWFKGFNKAGEKQTDAERSARYNYMYSPGELVEITEIINSLPDEVKKIFIITNNHPKGNAVANAFQLMNMLEKKKVEIPPMTLFSYPQLKEIAG
jgi:uncharacterized protein YecE (DUF72 family)